MSRPRREFIDFSYVKERADFRAVLAHYNIKLGRGRKGGEAVVPCPFHDDREPSCSISAEKRSFHCFGCEAKGNVLEFVADMEGLDRKSGLRAAAEKLALICGIALSARNGPAEGPRMPQDGPGTARRGVRPPARSDGPPARVQRAQGPSPAPSMERNELRPFGLKFVAHDHPYLLARGFDAKAAAELALGHYTGKGLMRGRIVIAIHDWWPDAAEPSRLVGFVGRWPADDVPEDELRWKFPEGFRKSVVLYNLHRIAGRRTKHIHVVEGFFDALRLHRLGFPAVALMGRSISDEQVELLWRSGCRYATVLMDGDDEGRAAAPIVHQAIGRRLFSRVLELPDGEDPASLPEAPLRTLLDGQ